jgi:Phage portal protein
MNRRDLLKGIAGLGVLKCEAYLPSLKSLGSRVSKSATRGERVLSSLFPNRGTGFPGGWSADRLEQILHLKQWIYVCVDAIWGLAAGITPNFAYVENGPRRGVTTKACHRGLMNLQDRGFGGSATIGKGSQWDYGNKWEPHEGVNSIGCSDGGHSWLTVGEYRSKALSVVKPHEDLSPLENDHPLRRLYENPNPYDTSYDIEYEIGMFEELTGVSYEWLVPNRWGKPCERWCIPSHWVWPRTGGRVPDGGLGRRSRLMDRQYDPGQEVGDYVRYGSNYLPFTSPDFDRLIQYYEIRPWGGMGSAGILRLPPDEVVMTRCKSPINKIDGYSKLSAIAQWIDSEESITKSRWSQFINQARPEFWVELPPSFNDPNDDMMARVEAKFAAKFQGEWNYGKPILTPPGAKITPLSFNPTEMAYFDSAEQLRDFILATFAVPPAWVGMSKDMTYGSLLATLMAFCTACINKRLRMRGLTRTKYLAARWDEPDRKVRIWYDDCTPVNPEQVNADIAQDIAGLAITPNEQRALRGRKQYRYGGDDPIVDGPAGKMPLPLNTQNPLDELAELTAPMAAITSLARSKPQDEEQQVLNGDQQQNGEHQPEHPQTGFGIREPNQKPSKNGKCLTKAMPGPFDHDVVNGNGSPGVLNRLAHEFLEQEQQQKLTLQAQVDSVQITAQNVTVQGNVAGKKRSVRIDHPDGTHSTATVVDG